MVYIKTAKEKLERRVKERQRKDSLVLNKFNEYCKTYSISDAVTLTANEFNISNMTVYNIRRRNQTT